MVSKQDIEQPSTLNRRSRDQQSVRSHISEESSCSVDIMDMVMREKNAAMFPEKATTTTDALHESSMSSSYLAPPTKSAIRQVSEASTPGAFRVGVSPGQYSSGQSISGDSNSSSSSESSVVIIPQASLVPDDEGEHAKASDRDLEAAKKDIPLAFADEVETLPARDTLRSERKRKGILCLSLFLCLLLIVGLLSGVLVVLLRKDESPKIIEIPIEDNLPTLPPTSPNREGGNGGNAGGNNQDFDRPPRPKPNRPRQEDGEN